MYGAGFENLKALIVEDNGHMRSLLRALLNSAGIKDVVEAAHGQAGMEALREQSKSLADFVNTIGWMTSFEQLQKVIQK